MLAGLMLLMTQISYGDAAVDRLLKEARKKQAQEQKQQGTVEEVTTEEVAPVTESGEPGSIQQRAAEIRRESANSKVNNTKLKRETQIKRKAEARANKAKQKNMSESEKMNVEIQRIKKRVDEINNNIETFHKTNEALEKM